MPIDFLSDTPWEILIESPRSQKGGASQWNCARNSVGLRGNFTLVADRILTLLMTLK
jgi:hypothetical protein